MTASAALPRDPGPAAWNSILPSRSPYPPLEGPLHADYLIVGAGWAGLSAARRLQQLQPQARVVVLEGRELAGGPAGRNSGFMIDLPHDLASDNYAGGADEDRRQTAINRAAIRFARAAAAEYGMPEDAVDPCGKINAAASVRGVRYNKAYASHLETLGEPYRLLDADAMRELTGSDYYRTGLWTPGTLMLQPALYIRTLAEHLQRSPALTIHENTPVTDLWRSGAAWQATTPQGAVTAERVILAVNGLIERFGYYRRRLLHLFTYASMTRRLSVEECRRLGGEAKWALLPADPMGSTLRRITGSGGDRIVVRNRFTYDPALEVSETRIQHVARDHDAAFAARFPTLEGIEMEYRWGGRLCLSLNNVGALGEVEQGVFSACCQNGLGLAKGTAAGILAAEQAAETGASLIPEYQPQPPPKPLWPKPFMWIGANGYLHWKEWRAGDEL